MNAAKEKGRLQSMSKPKCIDPDVTNGRPWTLMNSN